MFNDTQNFFESRIIGEILFQMGVKQIDQVMDEIETITTDLDILLSQVSTVDEP